MQPILYSVRDYEKIITTFDAMVSPTDKHSHDGVRLFKGLGSLTRIEDEPIDGVDLAAVLLGEK